MDAELVYGSTLAGSRHAADTYAYRFSAERKAFLNHFLRLGVMVRVGAFYKRDRLGKYRYVAFCYTLDHFRHGQFVAAEALPGQVRVDYRRLCNSFIHHKPLVGFIVLRVFHIPGIIKVSYQLCPHRH